jgi:hypothetical protein
MSQPLLEGDYIQDRGPDVVERLNQRILDLENRITDIETERPQIKRDAVVIVLSLLTESLRHVASGKMDIPDVSHATSGSGQDARWDAIKARLRPRLKEAVDILLVQGPMRRTQLAAALKMDYTNCTKNVITVLVRQGIVIENAAREIQLKTL